MPMSPEFEERLHGILPELAAEFGTPFHIYDETGIVQGGEALKSSFAPIKGFREFFAVKALPNIRILEILLKDLGFGFDCSSIPELELVRMVGAGPDDIMFTSNNTSKREFQAALDFGCTLNLDDVSFVDKIPEMPELVCFRYNPGPAREGESSIGRPEEAKFGVTDNQVVRAYLEAQRRGARRFGMHTMLITNEMDYEYMLETVRMLLRVAADVTAATGIPFDFINIGGGIGVPYKPDQPAFDLDALSRGMAIELEAFEQQQGYAPAIYTECGRLITGPHGVLVSTAINVMEKYRSFVGVDASASDFFRPTRGRHHHITVVDPEGRKTAGDEFVVDVIGSQCTNNDKFARQRALPRIDEGDFVLIHDSGAHGLSRGAQYNGRLRPKELLLRLDGSVDLIRRHETSEDYFRTQLDFAARSFRPSHKVGSSRNA
jgi:diaminopimelate decarboxylase